MRRLRGQETLAVYDEENYNLREGLQDIRYAREFLKRVGDEERRRFNECSWY